MMGRLLRASIRRAARRLPRPDCHKLLRIERLEERATPAALVAAYSFDEGVGGAVDDSSGNNNIGAIGNATWSTLGKLGRVLSFNGTNAMVTVNDADSLDLTTGMTLEAWVNPSIVTSNWRDVIYKGLNDIYYLEATSSGAGGPAVGGTFGGPPLQGPTPLAVNTWSHLAATYDGAMMRLYVNGVQVASKPRTVPIATSTGVLSIGGNPLYGQRFSGLIDEVRIYNRALSISEIQTDMNAPVDPSDDTEPPTAPGSPTATPVSSNQIDLSWPAATDNVGVTGYRVERQDPGSANFVEIASPTGTTFSDIGLAASSSYNYRVRALDVAGNLSPYSSVASAATPGLDAEPPTISLLTPGNGVTVSHVAVISAAAMDNQVLAAVEFYVDG